MKKDTSSTLGVVDALTVGLNAAIRRPWLALIPASVDLGLWLLPQFAIARLAQQFLSIWEAFLRLGFSASQPGANDMILAFRSLVSEAGKTLNLADALTGSWFSMPSAVATVQSPRLMLVSDVVMAPFGSSVQLGHVAAAPWRGQPVEVSSLWVALPIIVGCWLIGQLLTALYLRAAGREAILAPAKSDPTAAAPEMAPHGRWAGLAGLLALTIRLVAFTVVLSVAVFALYVPMGVSLLFMTGSSGAGGLLSAIVGGLTLWVLMWSLTSVFFVSEAMTTQGQPLRASILTSLRLVRSRPFPTFALIVLVNVILLGFRAAWGMIGQSAIGGLVAILGNAFLVTAMLLAVQAYFEQLQRREMVKMKEQTIDDR